MLEIYKRTDRTTYQILKLQKGSTAVFINNLKRLMMTNASRNMYE
jgi:hypothetical protein